VGGEERKEGRSRERDSRYLLWFHSKDLKNLPTSVYVCLNSVAAVPLANWCWRKDITGPPRRDGASRMSRLLAHMHMERGTGILPNGWES
jgi:hypothetical protein